jgi:hypothetical protein
MPQMGAQIPQMHYRTTDFFFSFLKQHKGVVVSTGECNRLNKLTGGDDAQEAAGIHPRRTP